MQTIPSLALLAFLIPLTGTIGVVPGAHRAVPLCAAADRAQHARRAGRRCRAACVQAAQALGLAAAARSCGRSSCRSPRRTILAGIKTSAVINVGTATIAAFIGAGGFGERIVTGLALNDHAMLLAGAMPAAALALAVHGAVRARRARAIEGMSIFKRRAPRL